MLLAPGALHAAVLEGTWFACVPELATPVPRNILVLRRQGASHSWEHAWSQYESAEGIVRVEGGELVLDGCRSMRGEREPGCDVRHPPEALRVSVAELQRQHRSIDQALRSGAWIRVGRLSQQTLDRRCEEVRDAAAAKGGAQR